MQVIRSGKLAHPARKATFTLQLARTYHENRGDTIRQQEADNFNVTSHRENRNTKRLQSLLVSS